MIKLLVVDDSALMRRLLTDIFKSAGDFEVEIARTGADALAKLAEFEPDVITLDVHMPEMDGLACLDQIMIHRPCPVVMVSSLTGEGADETLQALALGAVDFIAKPKGAVSLEIDTIAEDLVEKVRSASTARISAATRLRERVRARASGGAFKRPRQGAGIVARPAAQGLSDPLPNPLESPGLILVGCSTGGPPALDTLLGGLPAAFPWPIVVAQHMPGTFTGPLARRLDGLSALNVIEVDGPMHLSPGRVYIGKGDTDVIVSRRNGALIVRPAPRSADHFWHPSVDRLVDSAMRFVPAERLVGVLMTGMGNDGAAAMGRLKASGGTTIAEAQSTAVIWGMPGSLVQSEGASMVRPLDDIPGELTALLTP